MRHSVRWIHPSGLNSFQCTSERCLGLKQKINSKKHSEFAVTSDLRDALDVLERQLPLLVILKLLLALRVDAVVAVDKSLLRL